MRENGTCVAWHNRFLRGFARGRRNGNSLPLDNERLLYTDDCGDIISAGELTREDGNIR